MFGIGLPELIVILFIALPVTLFVFIFKEERRMEKDRESRILEIKTIFEQPREKRKSQ